MLSLTMLHILIHNDIRERLNRLKKEHSEILFTK